MGDPYCSRTVLSGFKDPTVGAPSFRSHSEENLKLSDLVTCLVGPSGVERSVAASAASIFLHLSCRQAVEFIRTS